ncbi:hypothetical protein F8A86_11555 [Betaproteobacteria bacterium SCN1]|nr:hypothetical protein F8A86_11555 [Betaproteobacteria bacterium SCN1]
MSGPPAGQNIKALLKQRGFSAPKAQIWSEFLRHVLQLYWQAAEQLVEPANWAGFKQKAGAMGKPKRGRAGTVIRIPTEDAITSEIGHRAEELRKALPSNHFLRQHDVCFSFESPVKSDKRAGRHSKKVDFRVCSLEHPGAPELTIEAKPLTSQRDIQTKYLAADGMGCFFSHDSAYSTGPLGAMLAYSINNDGSTMQEAILAALQQYQPKPLHIHRISIPGTGLVDCSHHDRAAWKMDPITILHLELNFPVEFK